MAENTNIIQLDVMRPGDTVHEIYATTISEFGGVVILGSGRSGKIQQILFDQKTKTKFFQLDVNHQFNIIVSNVCTRSKMRQIDSYENAIKIQKR